MSLYFLYRKPLDEDFIYVALLFIGWLIYEYVKVQKKLKNKRKEQ